MSRRALWGCGDVEVANAGRHLATQASSLRFYRAVLGFALTTLTLSDGLTLSAGFVLSAACTAEHRVEAAPASTSAGDAAKSDALQNGTPPNKAVPRGEPTGPAAPYFVGRVERLEGHAARYAWSGAGFVLRFQGSGVVVQLNDKGNWHSVLVDGQLVAPLVTREGQERYVLAEGLPVAEHIVEVYRRTEALFGPTELRAVEVSGGVLLPVGAALRRIEVVGDSISCGYGNEGAGPNCSFSAATENHFMAYGARLARMLGAELSTVAWSGRGVVKNYNAEPGLLMPVLYARALPEVDAAWRFETSADAVVVNLGTNDFSTEPDPDVADFAQAYEALLQAIRVGNPEAFILCTVGPMLSAQDLARAEQGIQAAVAARKAAGDHKIESYTLRTANARPGCDYHPSVATHEQMGAELAAVLRQRLVE